MSCENERHALGVWADNDGVISYRYDDTHGLYLSEIFKFCPECGKELIENIKNGDD